MQISGLPTISRPQAQSASSAITEPVKKNIQSEPALKHNPIDSVQALRAHGEDILRPVESSSANSGTHQRAEERGLPLYVQRALQSFAENNSSSGYQPQIELMGIDIFA